MLDKVLLETEDHQVPSEEEVTSTPSRTENLDGEDTVDVLEAAATITNEEVLIDLKNVEASKVNV